MGRVRTADAWAAGVGVRAVLRAIVLLGLAVLPQRALGTGCDATVVFGSIGLVSSCDLDLKPGDSYVLFATRGEDGLMRTRQCTGTALEREAAATIAALGAGELPDQ